MPDETRPGVSLDEQLDRILHPLGVQREVSTLDEQLDSLLHPLGVVRELPVEQTSSPIQEQEDDEVSVPLYFFSVLCEWEQAPALEDQLKQLLRATLPGATVMPGLSHASRCYFMVLALSPFPPHLLEQIRALSGVHDFFDFTTTLLLDDDDPDDAAGV